MLDSSFNPVTELTEEQSWAVLAGCKLGRLVTVVDRHPEIFPVNFIADGRSVVFRTAEGSKLFTLTINAGVAFEVDGWDGTGGWSVILRGRAAEVRESAEIARLEKLPLRPWVPTVKAHWVRVTVDEITGRQFRFGPEPESGYETTTE